MSHDPNDRPTPAGLRQLRLIVLLVVVTRRSPAHDHIALTVPNSDEQMDRLVHAFGMVVEVRFDGFALVSDPVSGLKRELGRSDDSEVHFRHLGFRSDHVDRAHQHLVEGEWKPVSRPPARRRSHVRIVPQTTGAVSKSSSSSTTDASMRGRVHCNDEYAAQHSPGTTRRESEASGAVSAATESDRTVRRTAWSRLEIRSTRPRIGAAVAGIPT